MAQTSRIRFNPATREVEIEGTETFVKSYFAKIQNLLSELQKTAEEKPTARPSRAPRKAAKEPEKLAAKKRLGRGDISTAIIETVRGSEEGIGIPALTKKTGFTQQQVRSVIFKAEKQGVIQRLRRGVYVAARS